MMSWTCQVAAQAADLLYILPNKDVYETGEDMWFKACPVQAELCVSLFDKWYQSDRIRETMLSHCYLSSQIRGDIHNPIYYFDKRNKDRLRALDLLLLTQGWRRYTKPSRGSEILTDGIRGKVSFKKKPNDGIEGVQAIQVSGHNGKTELIWTDSLSFLPIR